MSEPQEISETIDVPKNTGIEGFLRSLKVILQLPQVQKIAIDAKGKVSYSRLVTEEDRKPIGINFDDLEPWGVIRNGDIQEVPVCVDNAAVVITLLMDYVATEKLYPVAFVTGANSILNEWYIQTTGSRILSDQAICGIPLYKDRHIPDTALILCTAMSNKAALIDTNKSFKIEMLYTEAPNTTVEVL